MIVEWVTISECLFRQLITLGKSVLDVSCGILSLWICCLNSISAKLFEDSILQELVVVIKLVYNWLCIGHL